MTFSERLLTIGALALAFAVTANVSATESAAAPAPDKSPAHAVCEQAVVSPVSGFAECVKPRGAPVAPAPKRPDASSAGSIAPAPDPSPTH
ncbi:MAG TPA: hypothetical protein VGL28_02025 [Steroidobacteraceae bacterium]|jgi:hypothetical protein